ncbi:MAG: hypothetical protein P4L85_19775 [Paludisphaera borealis]|uniref:hypothetical protein n=1 Tax=Paludisphaera borealis TaxID=1387353 RepID=UPI002850C69F|nr:hypothetical protein [Paludisphaera borealis]MDR3621600.1 hypothetical protein [Paludisphaera borealis]
MFDARILRDRQEDALAATSRAARFAEDGSVAMLVQTKVAFVYPSSANAFFACSPVRLDGPESEGAAVLYVTDLSRTYFVYNLGTHVPPIGTKVIAQSCSGRWTFRFDG